MGGLQDLHHLHVDIQGRQAGGLDFMPDDGGEVRDRIAVGRGQGGGGDLLFILRGGDAGAQERRLGHNHIAGLAVDFHVLAVKGPVPRGLQDDLGLRITQNDHRVILHLGIDVRLHLLGSGENRGGQLAVEEPEREIRAVAAEIVHGAAPVKHRVRQPGEKVGGATDFLGTTMPGVENNFADIADLMFFMHDLVRGLVAGVPTRLVVHDYLDAAGLGGFFNRAGLFHIRGQRLFHHHIHVMGGTGFHHGLVIVHRGEGGDGLDVGVGEEGLERGIKEIGIQVEFLGVAGDEVRVGLHDAGELEIILFLQARNETQGVIVHQTDNSDGDGRFGSIFGVIGPGGEREEGYGG